MTRKRCYARDPTPALSGPAVLRRCSEARNQCAAFRLSIAVAASLVGISREAVRRRRRQDAQFDEDCARAIAEYEQSMLGIVNDGAADDPKMALEILARRFRAGAHDGAAVRTRTTKTARPTTPWSGRLRTKAEVADGNARHGLRIELPGPAIP